MIELNTLGSVDLLDRSDGHQVLSVLAQPKRVGFLTYLAVASPRGMHRRDTLLGVFWPDSSDRRARNALNQTVFVLRRALGQEILCVKGEAGICVDPSHLWCDVWEFEAALERGEKEDALDRYRGNFLEGFFLPGCLEFERWVDAERGRFRDLATGAVLSLSLEMEEAGNPVGAVGWLRRAREWAVYDELVLRRQIELLLALGDRSGAVREYESFARRLSVDLGMEPSKEVQHLLHLPPSVADVRLDASGAEEPASSLSLPSTGPGRARDRRFSRAQTAVIAGLAAVIGVSGALSLPYLRSGGETAADPSPPPREGSRGVMVLPLENATANPSLDPLGESIAEAIVEEISTTGLARVGPVFPPRHPPPGSGEDPNSTASPENLGWGLEDAQFLVTGSYSNLGGRMALQTRILELESGSIAVVVDSVVGSFEDLEEAIGRLRHRVAGALAMVLDPRVSHLAPVASHPPSFEAYQLFADGLDLVARLDLNVQAGLRWARADSAGEAFLRAAAQDPRFTLPMFFALDATYTKVDSVMDVLRPLRDELPRWERAMLDYHLARRTWDHVSEYQAMDRVVSITPKPRWMYLFAQSALWANRPRAALEVLAHLEQETDWLQANPYFWVMLGEARMLLGENEAVLQIVARARAVLTEHPPGLTSLEVEALARLGRKGEALARSIEALESSRDNEARILSYSLPRALRAAGEADMAREVAEIGVLTFTRAGGGRPVDLATMLACAGRYQDARELLEGYEEWGTGWSEPLFVLSYMAAREGDRDEVNRIYELAARDPAVVVPDGTPALMLTRAEASAHLGDLPGAVRFLQEAYDKGLAHGLFVFHNWDLTPLYGYRPFEDLIRPKG